jgi:small subunit ribosomal protein S17
MIKEKIKKKRWTGAVVSTKMSKTIVVEVQRTKVHPKYGKRMKRSNRFKVHCLSPEIKVGDKVIFEECRPLSRDKHWKLVSKII